VSDREGAFKKRGRAIGLTLATAGATVLAVGLTPPARDAVANFVRGLIATTPAVQGSRADTLNGVTVRFDRLGPAPGGQVIHVSATDLSGATVSVIHAVGLGDADYLSEAGGTKGWDLRLPSSMRTLTIDYVTVGEAGDAAVDLDIPPSGSISINRLLAIGRYPVSLTTGTWVDDGPNGHVFRIGFQSVPVGGRFLSSWAVDGVGSSIQEGPNVRTGDGWLEFRADAGHSAPPGYVTLSFKDPIVEIDGPRVLAPV